MGKRSDFERVERDFYPTPFAGSDSDGKDNAAWYLFGEPRLSPTAFHWRA